MEDSSTAADPDRILELAYGFRAAQALFSAAELDIFSILAGGPLDSEALALKAGIHPCSAADFFDALCSLRLIERDSEGRYSNSPEAARFLVAGEPAYVGGLIDYLQQREYAFFARLTAALRSGEPQSGARGTGNYPAFYADPAALDLFVRGMSGGTLPSALAMARAFPWRDYRTLLDIGTAEGCLPVAIAEAHPHMRCIGFDLPPVGPPFERYVAARGLSDRVRFQAGDFFNDALPPADVLVMSRILHNWNLPTKQRLIGKAFDTLVEGGALIVCEKLLDDERRTATAGLLNSLYMRIMTAGGFELTRGDCMAAMGEAGFRDLRAEPLAGDQWMVVGHK